MNSLLMLVVTVIDIYWWFLVIYVVLSWLYAFQIINSYNQFVEMIRHFLHQITEPLLRPIRRILPDMAGVDLSPLVLLLALMFLRNLVIEYWPRGM